MGVTGFDQEPKEPALSEAEGRRERDKAQAKTLDDRCCNFWDRGSIPRTSTCILGGWDCKGVVASFAPRKAAGFDSLSLHLRGRATR